MIPAHAATQNVRPAGDVEVVERVLRPALPDEEGDQRGERDDREADRQRALVRDGREVDRQDQRADEHDREDAAEVVDRLGSLVDVRRDEHPGHQDRTDRQRQREQEAEPHSEVLEQDAREERPERRDRAAERRPQRDRLRPRRARTQAP